MKVVDHFKKMKQLRNYQSIEENPELLHLLLLIVEAGKRAERSAEAWQDTASHHAQNAAFHRGLVEDAASHLGHEVFVDDAGGIHEDPLVLKVPELVEKLAADLLVYRLAEKQDDCLHEMDPNLIVGGNFCRKCGAEF